MASGDTISGSEQVQSGAFAENFNDYGVEQVQAGAFVENFTVQAGGVLSGLGAIEGLAGDGDYQAGSNVDDGSVRALSITGAAGLAIGSGGNASGLVISALDRNDLGFGRGLFVSAGGVAVNTKIGAGGTVGLRGGNLSNTTVLSGGILVNQSGGELLGTTMNAGTVSSAMIAGSLTVQSNGVDIFDTVLSGAVESVLAGGVTENFTVLKGGTLSGSGFITGLAGDGDYQAGYNIDDGNLNGLAITGAAGLAVASGGVTTGLLVSALDRTDLGFGRGLFVSSGGSVINTEVALSGTLGLRGGLATNTTVLFGGIVVEESGGRLRGQYGQCGRRLQLPDRRDHDRAVRRRRQRRHLAGRSRRDGAGRRCDRELHHCGGRGAVRPRLHLRLGRRRRLPGWPQHR